MSPFLHRLHFHDRSCADRPPSDHPKAAAIPSEEILQKALERVPQESKAQAYVAFLGFFKAMKRIHGMEAPAVVKLANRFAELGMGLDEPPAVEPSTVSKMGLKGVPGLRIYGKAGVPKSESKRPNPRIGSGKKMDLNSAGGGANANANAGPSSQSSGPERKRARR